MWAQALVALSLAVSVQGYNPISIQKTCDGFDKPCTIELTEGLDQKIYLGLDEPIICAGCPECDKQYECSVVVNFTAVFADGTGPKGMLASDIIEVNPCYIRWNKNEWRKQEPVRILAKTSYRHNGDKIKIIITSNVVTKSEYYVDKDPGDLYIETVDRGTATCTSVGDPHYTSFDGKYWNYYDSGVSTLYRAIDRDFAIMTRTHYNSNWPSNSVNCEIGGREGKDMLSIDYCQGRPVLTPNFNSDDPEAHPIIEVRGNSYSVYFHSGAYMHMTWAGHYMNINIGGVDTGGRSCGLCGDADGNPSNDKSGDIRSVGGIDACSKVPSFVKNGYPHETMGNIFDWKYDADDFAPEIFETPTETDCPYEFIEVVRPIVATDDIEDITEAAERLMEDRRNGANTNIIVLDDEDDDADEPVGEEKDFSLYTDGQLKDACEASVNQEAVRQCSTMFTEFGPLYVEEILGCVADLNDMKTASKGKQLDAFLDGVNSGIIELCITFAIAGGSETDAELTKLLCNGAKKGCGDHGTCAVDASCTCEDNWAGTDCTIDLLAPPVISAITDLAFDVRGLDSLTTPTELVVYGRNFHKSKDAVCRWGNPNQADCSVNNPSCWATMETTAFYAGTSTFICYVPLFEQTAMYNETLFRIRTGQESKPATCYDADGVAISDHLCFEEYDHNGAVPLSMAFSISNDGTLFSDFTRIPFKYYDSKCLNCTASGSCVERQTGSCIVGDVGKKQCYLEGETDPEDSCLECQPSINTRSMTYSFDSSNCKPKFINSVVEYNIYGSEQKGTIIIKGCGDADLSEDEPCVGVNVGTIPDAVVEYFYVSSAPNSCLEEGYDYATPPQSLNVSETTGAIYMVTSVSAADLAGAVSPVAHVLDHPCLFSGSFKVMAQVTSGAKKFIVAGIAVIIDVLPENNRKIPLPKGGFLGTIEENSPDGAPVLNASGLPLFIQLIDGPEFEDLEGDFKWIPGQEGLPGAFAVDQLTGAVTVLNSKLVDREAQGFNGFNVTSGVVTARVEFDEGLAMIPDSETVTITITNINDGAEQVYIACTDALLDASCSFSQADSIFSLPENVAPDTVVGTLETIDAENAWDVTNAANFVYTLTDTTGTLAAKFIDGAWVVVSNTAKNFEDASATQQWTVTVTSTDTTLVGAAGVVTNVVTVKVVDVDEPASNPLLVVLDDTYVAVNGLVITINSNAPKSIKLAQAVSIDPDQGDGNGDCSGVCGVWATGFVRTSEAAQEECPFEVTREGDVMRRPFICIDDTRADLAFALQCTFASNDITVESIYNISINKVGTGEPTLKWTPAAVPLVVSENVVDGTNTRTADLVIGSITVSDPRPRDTFLQSDFSFGRPNMFTISSFQESTVDGEATRTLEISLLSTAFLDRESFDCEGCYIVNKDCGDAICSEVPIDISLDGVELGECLAQQDIPILTIIDVNDVPTTIECVGNSECTNIVITESTPQGEEVVRFNIVDEDPTEYTVTLGGSALDGFEVAEVDPNRRRAAGISAATYAVIVKNASILIADAGSTVSLTITVQEAGGGTAMTASLDVGVTEVSLQMYPDTFSTVNPIQLVTSVCGSGDVTQSVWVGKAGINVTKYPSSLATYKNKLVWESGLAWISIVPSNDTLRATVAVDYTKYIAAGSPANGILRISTSATEVYVNVQVEALRYAPKFTQASYAATLDYSTIEEEGLGNLFLIQFESPDVAAFDEYPDSGQQRLEISVVELKQMPTDLADRLEDSFPVSKEPSCQANRYVTSGDINGVGLTNPLVWELSADFGSSDCLGDFVGQYNCVLKFNGDPDLVLAGGSLSPFKSGLFLKATWKDSGSAERSKLSAFAPLLVTVTDTDGPTFTTDDDDDADSNGSASENNSKGSTSNLGIAVGVVAVLLLILLIAGVIYFRHQKRKADHDTLFDGSGAGIYERNEMYREEPMYDATETDWMPGASNPMYDWYQPNMSRKECSEKLQGLGEGAYIVRDSDASKGWHMLGVKSQNRVVHDKIRLTNNSTYQLLPTLSSASTQQQPEFANLPELVGYYEQEHREMPYTLVGSDPIYDNAQLQQERTGTVAKANNTMLLPQKEREYATTGKRATQNDDSVGNPLYFASAVAESTYSETEGYLDVKGTDGYDQDQGTQGYLDVFKPPAGAYLDVDPI